MTGAPSATGMLIGLVAGPASVEAMLVERTPFGRLAPGGRRVRTDVDGPTHFVPLALERQLPSGLDREKRSRQADEERAADGWVQSIANAVAKLTFGLRAEGLRVGVAVDGRLDGRGRDLVAMREGARAQDLPAAIDQAMRGRGIVTTGPMVRCLQLGEAWALGEQTSALGLLSDLGADERALVVHWDEEVFIAEARRGLLPRGRFEAPGSRTDVGIRGLAARWRAQGGELRLLPAAVRGEAAAIRLLREAAEILGARMGLRLIHGEREAERLAVEVGKAPGPVRVVLGGALGRALLDERVDGRILGGLGAGLRRSLEQAPDLARRAELLDVAQGARPGLSEGLLQLSREASAPLIGAAALVLGQVDGRGDPAGEL